MSAPARVINGEPYRAAYAHADGLMSRVRAHVRLDEPTLAWLRSEVALAYVTGYAAGCDRVDAIVRQRLTP